MWLTATTTATTDAKQTLLLEEDNGCIGIPLEQLLRLRSGKSSTCGEKSSSNLLWTLSSSPTLNDHRCCQQPQEQSSSSVKGSHWLWWHWLFRYYYSSGDVLPPELSASDGGGQVKPRPRSATLSTIASLPHWSPSTTGGANWHWVDEEAKGAMELDRWPLPPPPPPTAVDTASIASTDTASSLYSVPASIASASSSTAADPTYPGRRSMSGWRERAVQRAGASVHASRIDHTMAPTRLVARAALPSSWLAGSLQASNPSVPPCVASQDSGDRVDGDVDSPAVTRLRAALLRR